MRTKYDLIILNIAGIVDIMFTGRGIRNELDFCKSSKYDRKVKRVRKLYFILHFRVNVTISFSFTLLSY